jgi:molecular chaperone DnaK (HSP70)
VGYDLGVDLGTTYTTAATLRDGRAEVATALTARLLARVVSAVAAQQGGGPDHLVVTCPAGWGPFKRDLLAQAVDLAAAGGEATIVSEPEAVATHQAARAPVGPGQLVAVYDLGDGTFDAAVLVGTGDGRRLVGEPTGIEQLGGCDFDDAVLAHVAEQTVDAAGRLDPDDPAVTRALARLRQACVAAKEALSRETEVAIPVALPGLRTEVRLTRAEFERLIRPTLATTLAGLRRALRSAAVEPGDLAAVVLAGSRASPSWPRW